MAAEAQAEAPALAPAPPPSPSSTHGTSPASPEKRGLPVPGDDGGLPSEEEERPLLPEPKRRRACVDALDGVPGAAAPSVPGWLCDGDGACFSFQPAQGGFAAPETTPKFGSFNPPGEAELPVADLDLKAAEPGADSEGSPEAEDEAAAASAAREAQVKDESSQLVGGDVDGQAQT